MAGRADDPRLAAMVDVSAGPFAMGCTDGGHWFWGCPREERPVHELDLPAFSIDLTEVTQRQYAACTEAGACTPPRPPPACGWDPEARGEFPVVCVSWFQARDFCAFAGKRLPTEAEWEKAARGDDGRRYPWGLGCWLWCEETDCDLAGWGPCDLREAGARPRGASPYGALDMAGNVWEWVEDWYDADHYARGVAVGPDRPGTRSPFRVIRGGAVGGCEFDLRTARRAPFADYDHAEYLGFRCAK